jgi:glycosyltransferase involved in cell wall biosynthesis
MSLSSCVSLLLVVRNEREHVEKALDSLMAQTYPRSLTEWILVDGMSTDGTREYLGQQVRTLKEDGLRIQLLDNPKRNLAAGWNIGIRAASGEMVCRIDAHSAVAADYVERGVEELSRYKDERVAAVGGWLTHVGHGLVGGGIAHMLSSRFAVGNSPFRRRPEVVTCTDTAVYGVYWKHVLESVGLFDERLERNQDIPVHAKLREEGFRFMIHPEMRIEYYVRQSLVGLLRKAFADGLWVQLAGKAYLRHRIPLFFMCLIIGLCVGWVGFLAGWIGDAAILLAVTSPIAVYLTAATYFAVKDGKSVYRVLLVPLFLLFHTAYGMGSLWAFGKLARALKRF